MTREQTNKLYEVEASLQECRKKLDNVMYYSEPITDAEHTRCRTSYDLICKAIDAL